MYSIQYVFSIQNVWFSGMKYTIRIFNTYRIVYIMYHIYPLYTKLNKYFTLDVILLS